MKGITIEEVQYDLEVLTKLGWVENKDDGWIMTQEGREVSSKYSIEEQAEMIEKAIKELEEAKTHF